MEELVIWLLFLHDGNISAVDLGNQKNIDKKIQSALYSEQIIDGQDLWDQVSNLILRPIMPKIDLRKKSSFSRCKIKSNSIRDSQV